MFISGSSTSTGSFHELHIKDKIGIGTSAPNRSLTIVSSEAAAINLDSSNNSFIHIDRGAINDISEIAFRTDGSNIFSMGLGNSNNLGDGTDFFIGTGSGGSGNVRFLIDSSGNVGINRTNPGYKFEVGGVILGTGGVYSYDRILAGNSTDGLPSFAFANDPDTGFRSDLSANVRAIIQKLLALRCAPVPATLRTRWQ